MPKPKTAGYVVLAFDGNDDGAGHVKIGVCVDDPELGCLMPFSGDGGTVYPTRKEAQRAVARTNRKKAGTKWEHRQHFVVRVTEWKGGGE